MNIAIIPARGGSKRIKRKNIKLFSGKPMIYFAIEAARLSGIFDKIIVSTDDDEIAQYASSIGAEIPFIRPMNLSDDHTPTVPVISHAISECKKNNWNIDNVCCIYPAVPLLNPRHITDAFILLLESPSKYIFPVTSFPSAIQRALKSDNEGNANPIYPEYSQIRTQDLEPAFYDVGQFYWGHANNWTNNKSIHDNARIIQIPEDKVVDIDTPEDWDRAELLFKYNQEKLI
jgi:pseudaminic acid cytidylyltransferase